MTQLATVITRSWAPASGKVSTWRGDHAATVRHLERAAWCADQLEGPPWRRYRLDIPLAEASVAAGLSGDARRISAWLRELATGWTVPP